MIDRRRTGTDTHGRWGDAEPGRVLERHVAALLLAALLVVGAALGVLNLLLDGVVRPGTSRWVYGTAMVSLVALAAVLVVRPRVSRAQVAALVLAGDLVSVVVALTIEDPIRFAPPLVLLFPAFVAAWFLGPGVLAVHLLVTVLACAAGLWPSIDSPGALAVQVVVNAGVLGAASCGVFVLRRRVERLLRATRALSHQDPLTGLPNRRHLVDQVPRVWRQARRDGARVAAMVLDLDHFKQLNDAHGHAAGDAVLRAVAGSLSATVRPTDVLARIGGEELVVLGLVSDTDEAGRLAERLRAAVAGTRTPTGHAVTASIGIALTRPEDGETPAEAVWRLVDRADGAMYQAKQAGRDRVSAALPRPRPAGDVGARAADPV
ncbi:GGDEF domain-containing protein [Geodermatophilus marinus]|uniref:GGDEF domain-containing protein n=1 Tax=Geodermatophilus sp. LHW52908 TaxID=2303986 RepID=UPI001F360791|nr:GGDEF domain-containing protein [Geodermatophilus sp. LHW52908]